MLQTGPPVARSTMVVVPTSVSRQQLEQGVPVAVVTSLTLMEGPVMMSMSVAMTTPAVRYVITQ